MKTAEQYFKRIKEAKTSEDLFTVYTDFKDAFVDDIITLEQYLELRRAWHNSKWCRL